MYTLLVERRKKNRLTLDIALICIALFWISRGKYLLSLLLVGVALIGFYINRNKVVTVSADNIRYPFIIDKTIEWSEVANILLKDDVLTIDLKNNKLLQSTVTGFNAPVDEKEFNEFCSKQMGAVEDQALLKEKS